MAHDVFISYSAKDKPAADAVCARLEAKGVRCWIAPRDVMPGTEWSEAIIDGINGSRAMVLVYSQNANESPQIRREVERAVAKGVAIIPLRLENVPLSKSLEYFISAPHWLDAITPPLDQHLDYLAETLKRIVHPAETVDSPPRPVPLPAPVLTPGPNPVPRKSWVKTAIIGGIALLFIVATLSYFFSTPRNEFDQRLVGSWASSATVNNQPVQLTMTLDQNGHGMGYSTFRDRGRYNSGRGQWVMTSAAGQTLRGTYTFTSADMMSMAGPLGTATWRRDPGSPPDPAGRLAGKWTLPGTAPNGSPMTTTLTFAGDGTYQFDATSVDTYVVQASAGKWHSRSSTTGKVIEGTYRIAGPAAFSITNSQGTASWTRQP